MNIISRHRLLRALLIAGLFLIGNRLHAADFSYEYHLQYGASSQICRHMSSTFNHKLSRLWSEPPNWLQLLKTDFDWANAFPSWYPTSPEFDAVDWKRGSYPFNGHRRLFTFAQLDIANNGSRFDVIKDFFTLGPVNSIELLKLYPPGTFDPSHLELDKDLADYGSASVPTIIGGQPLVRPFVLNQRVFLATYTFNSDTNIPFATPEFMQVRRYLGVLDGKGIDKIICVFKIKNVLRGSIR